MEPGFRPVRIFQLEFKFIRLTLTPLFLVPLRQVISRVINRDLTPEKHGLKRMIMRIDGHAFTTLRKPPLGVYRSDYTARVIRGAEDRSAFAREIAYRWMGK